MKTLLIDDVRNIEADKVARTFAEGIEALENGPWDVLYLDHDLGEKDGNDGTGIMNWLEEFPEYKPGRIEIVSSNPVGRERMQKIINKIYSEEK